MPLATRALGDLIRTIPNAFSDLAVAPTVACREVAIDLAPFHGVLAG
jgi:hypothetical protein